MRKPMNIGIDVDLTFVDSGTPWLHWLELMYGVKADCSLPPPNPQGKTYYNLSKYFPPAKVNQLPPYEFWEDPYLYDRLKPRPGAVEAVAAFAEAGHFNQFVSYCKKGHFSSKVRFLKRETEEFFSLEPGSGHGFYATKNKAGLKLEVIIDDRNEFLNQFGDDVLKIKFWTPYDQSEELKVSIDLETSDWSHIQDFILDLS
ncbi:hypothetical protein KB57_129 [Klebsiella phage vB_KpnM_KB57]|uniref:Uncharacterized protein n=1 Tax=Klebsiella phage vB_KpnM_KB57 TaxID=1719140 RepID=A0A0S1S2I6_9CAUD|nr:hypothetical protein KB57_129 [Klebsiella phage vB_KpnM_KB57]ALM02516.1 hypothetical protein KB57_129 [Klebsiella phage vB_KpnM_KB57]